MASSALPDLPTDNSVETYACDIECVLTVENGIKGKHTLTFFGTRDAHSHGGMNTKIVFDKFNGNVSQPSQGQLYITLCPKPPAYISICWFCDMTEKTNVVQRLIAWGTIEPSRLSRAGSNTAEVRLFNSDSEIQGYVSLSILSSIGNIERAALNKQPLDPTRDAQRCYDQLDEDIERHYQRHQRRMDDYFHYSVTPMGHIPLISYVYNTTLLKVHRHKRQYQTYFWNALQYAKDYLCVERLDPENTTQMSDVLAEILTIHMRCLTYCEDVTYVCGERCQTDSWVILSSFPNFKLAAYDCEDGSQNVLEMIHCFRTAEFDKEYQWELCLLQTHLSRYASFFTIGEIYVNGHVESHVFVVLLDSTFSPSTKDNGFQSESYHENKQPFAPAILLESTGHCAGVWREGLNDEAQIESFDEGEKKCRCVVGNAEVHNREPVSVLKRKGKYRRIITMLSADSCSKNTGGQGAVHYLCVDATNMIGVNTEEVLLYKRTWYWDEVTRFDTEQQMRMMQGTLYRQPHSTFPEEAKEIKEETVDTRHARASLIVRAQDFKNVEASFSGWSQKTYRLSKDLGVVLLRCYDAKRM